MDALVTASFLLVGWNTYSAIIVAKDTYTGKMPGPKSIGYSIAGLAGLTAFMLYTYGIAAEKHPELLEAEDRDEEERMSRSEAEDLAEKIEKMVEPYVDRVEVCGSYRRGSPTPGDLDVIIIPKKGITLPMMIEDIKPAQVNWLGEKKTQIVVDGHKIDFRVSSPKGWGAALLYFTGPAGYNIGMRMRAKKMGMKLNEYGIFDRNTDTYLGGETEDEIYQVLGKTPKTPSERSKRAEQTFSRTKADPSKCSYCGVIGETFTVNTTRGLEKHFCGPVCHYKYEGMAAESFSAEGDEEVREDIHSGSYHGIKHRSYDGVRYKGNLLKCKCGSEKEFHYPYGCYSCGPQAHRGKGRIAGFTRNGRIVWKDECTGRFMVDFRNAHGGKTDIRLLREGSSCSCKEAESFSAHTGIKIKKCPSCHEMQPMDEDMEACDDCAYCEYCEEYHPYEIRRICYEEAYSKHYEGPAEVFEAPRATYTDPAQQSFEKSYHIRAKKPLNKIVKDSLGGKLPSDDSRGYYYSRATELTNLSREDYKTIQGYLAIQNMAESRFQATNSGWAGTDYPKINESNAIEKSIQKTNYLRRAVKHYHGLAGLSDDDIIEYIGEYMSDTDFDEMLAFIRYYDITEIGPYKGIRMVATDRAPYETGGGYGQVYYNSRNPYDSSGKHPANFGTYDKAKQTLTLHNRDQGSVFTRLTKLRPYTEKLPLSKDPDAYIEYDTDGGYGYRSSGSQSFRLTPFVCPETNRGSQRNPEPGYSSRQTRDGWRYDIKGWEEVKSAAYRYATIVYLPSQKELQAAHGSGRELPRQTIVAIYNTAKKLNAAAKAAKKAKQEQEEKKEEQSQNLARKNKAIDSLQNATKSMQETLKVLVRQAKNAGVDEDDIYDALEHTLYDIEEMIEDWEPSDYWDAEGKKEYGCKKCGTGPHKATIVEDKVFVLCPDCGLVGGTEDATGWSVTWTKDTPNVLAKRPFADVEWETNSEE